MAITRTATSPMIGSENAARQHAQPSPKQSDIRGLGAADVEQTQEFELTSKGLRRQAIAPPPVTLDAAAEDYARWVGTDSEVLRALNAGDLPLAIVTLMHENYQLCQQNASWQSDFEELRSANITQQEDAHARLAAADDQRLQSLDQLEQTRAELVELEGQWERTRLDYENDLEGLRQQRDALQLEVAELRDLLPPSTR